MSQKFIPYRAVDTEIISALRADQHEVFYIPEQDHDFSPEELCQKANNEGYLMLTGDKSYADELLGQHRVSSGIVFIDIEERNLVTKAKVVLEVVLTQEDNLKGTFTRITKQLVEQTSLARP